ncbi:hypothetical protein RND81_11G136400 [Saponaria officinalis]|uniref:Uncharacterized protein n=1 Tax=Saponaria officinalis TaxID=3572 RepID=A0AAW1HLK4_SAPOF
MNEISMENGSMQARIQQLEQERDELHKAVENLCMQKAGPSFISLATQTYFRRTAGLEQEVENLKKTLLDCSKENSNIKDKLSEAQMIKTHLDQLHKLEISKNSEVVKQLEHLREVVATAFDDRDRALVEAEKAKESEKVVCQNLNDAEMRLRELNVRFTETEEQVTNLRMNLEKQKQEIENYRKVIDKFYEIRQHACSGSKHDESKLDDLLENVSWDEKFACLYDDPSESWSFNGHRESYPANYVADLLDEVEMLRGSVGDLQNKLEMGFENGKRLKSEISIMRQKKILSDRHMRHIVDGVSSLREYHGQQKIHITELLNDERSFLQSVVSGSDEMIRKLHENAQAAELASSSTPKLAQLADFSESLAQALQEKVSALLLLSNQERHIWEKNVVSAVQETVDELQRYLKLASEEKVKALLELAEVKQQYQQLLENTVKESLQGNIVTDSGERRHGKLQSLWKKTSKRLLGTEDNTRDNVLPHKSELERFPNNQTLNHSIDNSRLRNEYATLNDSIRNLEHWTSDVRKLRLSLIQAKMRRSLKGPSTSNSTLLDETIREAELLKNALSSTLPLSWSVEPDVSSSSYDEIPTREDDKIDPVLVAGLEMVELLIMTGQILKDKENKRERKLN